MIRLMWACMLSMGFLIIVGLLGSDRIDSLVQRPVIFVATLVPVDMGQSLASAILMATVAVFLYAVLFWLVLTAWNRLRSR